MSKKYGAWLVVVTLTGLTPVSVATQSTGTILQSVQAVEEGGRILVTLQANGPLPLPTFDLVDGPPRIYLDLAGVRPQTAGTPAGPPGGVVTRTRVALHSASPSITRVVLDLTRRETYRVDADERHLGRIRILVGSEAGPPRAAVPAARGRIALPGPPASVNPKPVSGVPTPTPGIPAPVVAVPSPSTATPRVARKPILSSPVSARPVLPTREIEMYRQQLSGALERMQARRSVVVSIDVGEYVGADALSSAAREFTDIRRILETIKPSSTVSATHGLLMASCTLGAVAANLRIDAERMNSPEPRGNAASAAAGALMFFDLACGDLACNRAPR